MYFQGDNEPNWDYPKPINKDTWIQKVKALLFDCTFCVDSEGIKEEIDELIKEGGGYDYKTETSDTKLNWLGLQ